MRGWHTFQKVWNLWFWYRCDAIFILFSAQKNPKSFVFIWRAKVENSNFKCFKTFLFVLNRREESSAFFGRHKIRNSKEVSCDKSFLDREFFQNLYHDFWCVLLQQLKETLVTSFASPQLHKLKVKIMSKFVLYHIFHISVKSFT